MTITSLSFPRIVRIGGKSLAETPAVLRALGTARPLVITDPLLVETGLVARLEAVLAGAGLACPVFAHAAREPDTDAVDLARDAVLAGDYDCLIGFGGGSPIDTAKAVAVLSQQGGRMRDYKAPRDVGGPALPVIAIPTTAGTGSEVTRFTVIQDSASEEKMLCLGPAFMPAAAIVDYELTLSMPPRLTADTGIDALTHALEAFVSRKAIPVSDMFARAALAGLSANLRRAHADPADHPAREAMMLGATQAGIAFCNSSVALVHGMSRPIGAHFHVPHGLSNAMLLPTVTRASAGHAPARYADCARAMALAPAAAGDDEAIAALVAGLAQLNADLDVPSPETYGLDRLRWQQLLPLMAEEALGSGSPANNPFVPNLDEIIGLYHAAWA